MASFKKFFSNLYGKHLLATNVVTCAGLLGAGDCLVQRAHISMEKRKGRIVCYDYLRTGRMIVIGCVLGPFNHYWYSFLDKRLVGKSGNIVFKKIMCDQAVAGPFFCSSFLMGMGLLEGKGLKGAAGEWKEKFLTIYMVDWLCWPFAQFINFRFLPGRFRVLYVSWITLMWNSFLSYYKHRDFDGETEIVHAH